MIRKFIEVPLFTKRWKEIGLSDPELHALQLLLLKDPESGPFVKSLRDQAALLQERRTR